MTQPTLYPHEVVLKWFKELPVITICISTLVAGATIIACYMVTDAITSVPPLGSNLMQSNTLYVTSCSSPISLILGGVLVVFGTYFAFNLLSHGELI